MTQFPILFIQTSWRSFFVFDPKMRSAVIFAALAVGTCAKVIEKEVYVTEWTTTTVTKTVTEWPTNTPSTAVSVKQDHAKPTNAALPTVDVAKKAPAKVESAPAAASTTAAAPTTAAAVVESEPSSSTTFSTSSSTTEAELKTVATAAPVTTSVATSSATSTTAAATAASSATSSYQESILHYHNLHRSDHSASGLTWSEDLAAAANTLASRCEYGHDT